MGLTAAFRFSKSRLQTLWLGFGRGVLAVAVTGQGGSRWYASAPSDGGVSRSRSADAHALRGERSEPREPKNGGASSECRANA